MNLSDNFKKFMGMVGENAQQLKKDLTPTPLPSGPEVWEAGKEKRKEIEEDILKKRSKSGIIDDVFSVGKAAVAAVDINYNRKDEWINHVILDTEKTKPYFDTRYGGHTRAARDAGSFYGGYDAAIRFPDKVEELKTLAKGYQIWSGITRAHKKDASFADEMRDAEANIAGIEAAFKAIQEGKKYSTNNEVDEDIASLAEKYSESYKER